MEGPGAGRGGPEGTAPLKHLSQQAAEQRPAGFRNSLDAARFKSVMTRLAIALLALTYLTPLAAPVACLHHGSDDRPACASPDVFSQESALYAPDPCDACGMPDCRDMITCTATSAAVTERSVPPLIPSTGRSTEHMSAPVTHGPSPAPALPPPRA